MCDKRLLFDAKLKNNQRNESKADITSLLFFLFHSFTLNMSEREVLETNIKHVVI